MGKMTEGRNSSHYRTKSMAADDAGAGKVQWHAAFCAAMRLELKQDEKFLQFMNEYNLNSKPLEIDLLIVKKPEKHIIESPIGKIFRKHNILEYKSPKDELNVDTFFKVNGYACLYKAYGRYVDEIKADSVTISFIRSEKPSKLLEALRKKGFAVENPFHGVYYISGKTYFRTQIIVVNELPGLQYIWLQSLTKEIDELTARELIRQSNNLVSQGDKVLADSVLAVSVKANKELFGKIKEGYDMYEALKELMADEINCIIEEVKKEVIVEGREEGIKEGREEGKKEGIKEGREEGKKEGIKEGREEGRKEGVRVFIESCQELGVLYEQVLEKLEEKFGLTKQEAKEYTESCWKRDA